MLSPVVLRYHWGARRVPETMRNLGLEMMLPTLVSTCTNTGALINERRPASPGSIYQHTTTTVSKDQICPSAIRSAASAAGEPRPTQGSEQSLLMSFWQSQTGVMATTHVWCLARCDWQPPKRMMGKVRFVSLKRLTAAINIT